MGVDSIPMGRRKKRAALNVEQVVEFLNHLLEEKPLLPFVIPLILLLWVIERWFFSFSNWVPLAIAVWATIQVGLWFSAYFLNYHLTKLLVYSFILFFFGKLFSSPLFLLILLSWMLKGFLLICIWLLGKINFDGKNYSCCDLTCSLAVEPVLRII